MASAHFVTINGSDTNDLSLPVPVTPQSKKRVAKHDDSGITTDESPTKKTKTARGIPRTLDEASDADMMLLRMKKDDRPWADINAAWEDLTGEKPGKSTLPNRLARLKANLATFTAEDDGKMLRILKELDEQYEREKWGNVASALEGQGGSDKFTALQIQKRVKELEKKAAVTGTAV